jgi:hypothetical protein
MWRRVGTIVYYLLFVPCLILNGYMGITGRYIGPEQLVWPTIILMWVLVLMPYGMKLWKKRRRRHADTFDFRI